MTITPSETQFLTIKAELNISKISSKNSEAALREHYHSLSEHYSYDHIAYFGSMLFCFGIITE